MDPRQIKKKDLTFKAGKKPGMLWIIVAWGIIILFTVSCLAFIGIRTPKVKQAKNQPAQQKASPEEEELNYWKKAVQDEPNNSTNLSNLAYYYQKSKKYTEAEEYYNKCLKIDPKYKFAINNLGLVYLSGKKYDKARVLWTDALKQDPTNSDYHFGLCQLSVEEKNYADAEYFAEKVIKMDPGNLSAYEALAYVYKIKGDTQNAVKVLGEALKVAKLTGDKGSQVKIEMLKQQIAGVK